MMEQALQGSTLELFQEVQHLSLSQILDNFFLRFVARTSIKSYQQQVDQFKRHKDQDLQKCMMRANKLIKPNDERK